MEVIKQKEFLIKTVFWVVVASIVIFTIKIGGGLLFPFILGFLVAFLLKIPINFISKKTRINSKVVSISILVLFYLFLISIVIALGDELASDISELVHKIPQIYKAEIEPVISISAYKIQTVITDMFGGFQVNLSDLPNKIASVVTSFSGNILKLTSDVAVKIPSFLLNILLIVISSFFFTLDYHRITNYILRQFSPKIQELIIAVKSNTVETIRNFIKAYGIIIVCTTVELLIGLSLLGVKGAIFIAFTIAIIDILPVLGTGTVLIPWAAMNLSIGNTAQAAGLLILWVVVLVIRQILEPKILGNQIGLPPILILISIYVGLKLFGAIGIFLMPIMLTVIKNLNENGIIRILK